MSLFNNAKWVAISQVVKVLVQLINIVYLARLIPPGEYGIMAMALVIINFGMLIRDLRYSRSNHSAQKKLMMIL